MRRHPFKKIYFSLILGILLTGAQGADPELRTVSAEQVQNQQIQAQKIRIEQVQPIQVQGQRVPPPSGEGLQGFQEWKQKRIIKARTDLNSFKSPNASAGAAPAYAENQSQVESSPALSVTEGGAPSSDTRKANQNQDLSKRAERLRQLEFNLEIALGLTIHDYFALYLKDKSKAEMAQVVGQLSPEELSELLVSYRDALYGAPIPEKEANSNLR